MVDGKRIFAPVEICKFPGFNIGIFDHAIYQLVWSPWFLPSTVRVAKGFFRSPTWLTEPRRYSNTLKAWSYWKLPGKPPGSWGWSGEHNSLGGTVTGKKNRLRVKCQRGNMSSIILSTWFHWESNLTFLLLSAKIGDCGRLKESTNQKPIPNPTSFFPARLDGLWSIMGNERRTWRWSRIPNLDTMRKIDWHTKKTASHQCLLSSLFSQQSNHCAPKSTGL